MKKEMKKAMCDMVILLAALALAVSAWYHRAGSGLFGALLAAALLCAVLAAADLFWQLCRKKEIQMEAAQAPEEPLAIQELLLLDEYNKPVKSWGMAGKTALVIGRRNENEEEEIDVDLEGCEYSTFVDSRHAVLNYCLDRWYLEDLGSVNGVRVQKAEDGCCYKVTNRPCRVAAGDIIYIANTKLLLT